MDVADLFDIAVDYGFTDLSNATMLRAIQGTVDRIERLRPWPFLEASVTLTYAGGSATASNTGLRIRSILQLRNLTTGAKVFPLRLDQADEYIGGNYTTAGDPIVYYLQAGVLNVYPLPASTTSLKLRYLQYSDRLTASSVEADFLIPARHHEVIQFGMLRRLYDQQDDPELAATMAQQHDQLLSEMTEDLMKQQYDEPDVIQILDINDWDGTQ